ncbi:hypothetical protein NW762_000855 [Fusarium torreyae]|uniref:Trafficking protein particle complex subunit n=1 Tax=Fusarium torreyae TaxID=1237075 RepID=A0A9W8SH79_9HYPO|nr:hypothetical protein NW762_000855 [Fusarium torreyae]
MTRTHLTLISLTLVHGLSSDIDALVSLRGRTKQHRDTNDTSEKSDIMTIFAVIIINKAGGLIYNKNFNDGLQQISTNDYLVLAGTFHGVHAITSRLNPVKNLPGATAPGNRPEPSSGLEVLETENFRMQCFNTLTGTKFLLFTDTTQANVDVTIRRIYDLYSDYVMKNPFYSLEMPVRCDIFDRKLLSYIREINNR